MYLVGFDFIQSANRCRACYNVSIQYYGANFFKRYNDMKIPSINGIQWYEPDDNRRKPTATLKDTGALCFGTQMREELSSGKIKIGFDSEDNTIVVKANLEQGSSLSKNGEVNLSPMAIKLRKLGINLPAAFIFFYESKNDIWRGYLIPSPRKLNSKGKKDAILSDECTSIIVAYKWLIDKSIYRNAKTTPVEERRAIATAALWEAINNYTQSHGIFKEYLYDEIKFELLRQNKQYVKNNSYSYISFDAPVGESTKSGTEAYELLLPRHKNEMLAVENKMHLRAFCMEQLSRRERKILRMLLDGFTSIEIQHEFNMTDSELYGCCKDIGQRWTLHNVDGLT